VAKSKNAAASLPSLLTPDPSSSLARSLVIHSRTLDVTRAVTRDEAAKLKDEGIKKREKEDKRNIYLMREGGMSSTKSTCNSCGLLTSLVVIFPNTPAANTLPAVEVEKRVSSFNQRRALLLSNPSLYVSKTRLSVRQLPVFVSERSLKKLALHACKAFEKEVKDYLRAGLTPDEFSDTAATQERQKPEETAEAAEKIASGRQGSKLTSRVKQAKIVRLSERVDPLTGKGRSKGYGFLEMRDHADALRVLRWANNNPDVQALLREWYQEEVEDLVKSLEKDTKGEDAAKARLHRAREALKEFEGQADKVIKSKRTLILEFSIENILIVKKRASRGEEHRSAGPDAKVRKYSISGGKNLTSFILVGQAIRCTSTKGGREG
jgi:nucleolar protein 4